MRPLLYLLCPVLIWAQSYEDVISSCDQSLIVKSAEQLKIGAWENYRAAEGKNLPTLDAHVRAINLLDTPTMTFLSSSFQVATKKQMEGEILLTYPLFTGFAISASIDKARFNHEKAVLQVADTKRNLYLNATRLYSSVAAADTIIHAQQEAKKAMEDSYKKAKGLYDYGLLAPSGLYAIEAKKYEIEAELSETQSKKAQALNQLSYITGTPISDASISADSLAIPSKNELLTIALTQREDLLALSKSLDIAQSDVVLAQSRYYPNVAVFGALKRQGDTLALNGDGYTNADKSYAGIGATWNLFNGMSDTHTIQAAEAAKLASSIALEDYKQRISAEIDNAFLDLATVQSRLNSAKMQVKAAHEYAKLTQGRFDNQLASADELSRAIADLAAAKAKTAYLESELFNQSAALWLQGGLETYQEKVLKN